MEVPPEVWAEAKKGLGNSWSPAHAESIKSATNNILRMKEDDKGTLNIEADAGIVIPDANYQALIDRVFEKINTAWRNYVTRVTTNSTAGSDSVGAILTNQ